MKTTQIVIAIAFIFLTLNTVSAQYGNGYGGNGYGGNGYGGNGYGNSGYGNSGRMSQQNQPSQPDKPKEISVEETVSKIMERLQPALNLDELQTIAVANVLNESIRAQGVLMKQTFSQEDQVKNYQALAETTDRKINAFLNEDQKPKYLAFKESKPGQKKSKSKAKNKKD